MLPLIPRCILVLASMRSSQSCVPWAPVAVCEGLVEGARFSKLTIAGYEASRCWTVQQSLVSSING